MLEELRRRRGCPTSQSRLGYSAQPLSPADRNLTFTGTWTFGFNADPRQTYAARDQSEIHLEAPPEDVLSPREILRGLFRESIREGIYEVLQEAFAANEQAEANNADINPSSSQPTSYHSGLGEDHPRFGPTTSNQALPHSDTRAAVANTTPITLRQARSQPVLNTDRSDISLTTSLQAFRTASPYVVNPDISTTTSRQVLCPSPLLVANRDTGAMTPQQTSHATPLHSISPDIKTSASRQELRLSLFVTNPDIGTDSDKARRTAPRVANPEVSTAASTRELPQYHISDNASDIAPTTPKKALRTSVLSAALDSAKLAGSRGLNLVQYNRGKQLDPPVTPQDWKRWAVFVCLSIPRDYTNAPSYEWSLVRANHKRLPVGAVHYQLVYPPTTSAERSTTQPKLRVKIMNIDEGYSADQLSLISLQEVLQLESEDQMHKTLQSIGVSMDADNPSLWWVENALKSLACQQTLKLLEPNNGMAELWEEIKEEALKFTATVRKDESSRTGSSAKVMERVKWRTLIPAFKLRVGRMPPLPKERKDKNKNAFEVDRRRKFGTSKTFS
ncbi:hypothetical protein EG329_004117 [Mollisiaceae sp. DMI_Dod_QoI]|nr:hypothetical protein EG329_004117 [Helotiales sp. DMI_Dod_QoI]